MFTKLFIVMTLAAAALAREYPAGVHPAVCPNYPYCDSDALARFTPDGTPIPEWVRNPGLLPVAPVAYAPAATDPAPAAARYPADFPAALCPNYPYCW